MKPQNDSTLAHKNSNTDPKEASKQVLRVSGQVEAATMNMVPHTGMPDRADRVASMTTHPRRRQENKHGTSCTQNHQAPCQYRLASVYPTYNLFWPKTSQRTVTTMLWEEEPAYIGTAATETSFSNKPMFWANTGWPHRCPTTKGYLKSV